MALYLRELMNLVYLDNNVWDFAYQNNVDLMAYFPRDKFTLAISKHGRFEINQMPDKPYTIGLKKYIFSLLGSDMKFTPLASKIRVIQKMSSDPQVLVWVDLVPFLRTRNGKG